MRFHVEDERQRQSQLEAHLVMRGWGPQSPALSQWEGLVTPLPSQSMGCVPLPQSLLRSHLQNPEGRKSPGQLRWKEQGRVGMQETAGHFKSGVCLLLLLLF